MKKFILFACLFLFAIIALVHNCFLSAIILFVLSAYSLPIKIMEEYRDTQLEVSYKLANEKQPTVTFEQYKQSSKVIYLVICIILCFWVLGKSFVQSENMTQGVNVENATPELESRLKSIIRGQNTVLTVEKAYVYKSKSIDDLYFIGVIAKGSFDKNQKDNTYNCILACSDAKCSLFGLAMNTQAAILFNVAPLSILTENNEKSTWESVNNINQGMDGYLQMVNKLKELNPSGEL